ncbi:hypothetical protein [Novipirellula caenicola]|uniref:hypothetical protein n=1 Tax=Novipirellula caenicola TaxID=1536901 RepID=UPI0031EBDDFE
MMQYSASNNSPGLNNPKPMKAQPAKKAMQMPSITPEYASLKDEAQSTSCSERPKPQKVDAHHLECQVH